MTGAAYREYQPGWCENPNCQKDLGLAQQYGGRNRKYCDGNCRKAAFRHREKIRQGYEIARQVRIELLGGYELDDATLMEVAKLAPYGPGAIKTGCEIALGLVKAFRGKAEKRGIFL